MDHNKPGYTNVTTLYTYLYLEIDTDRTKF